MESSQSSKKARGSQKEEEERERSDQSENDRDVVMDVAVSEEALEEEMEDEKEIDGPPDRAEKKQKSPKPKRSSADEAKQSNDRDLMLKGFGFVRSGGGSKKVVFETHAKTAANAEKNRLKHREKKYSRKVNKKLLRVAKTGRDIEWLQEIIEERTISMSGVDHPDKPTSIWNDTKWRNGGNSPLHIAVKYRSDRVIHMLVDSGWNIHQRNASDFTPLMLEKRHHGENDHIYRYLYKKHKDALIKALLEVQETTKRFSDVIRELIIEFIFEPDDVAADLYVATHYRMFGSGNRRRFGSIDEYGVFPFSGTFGDNGAGGNVTHTPASESDED